MNQQEPSLKTLEGERGIPGVNTPRFSSKKRVWATLGGVIAVLALGGMIYKQIQGQKAKPTPQKTAATQQLSHSAPKRTFETPAPSEAPGVPPLPQGQDASAPVDAPPPLPAGSGKDALKKRHELQQSSDSKDAPPKPKQLDKSDSALMVDSALKPVSSQAEAASSTATDSLNPRNGLSTAVLSDLLEGPSSSGNRSAKRLKKRHLVLAKGSFIECVLQTRLDSTVPGMTACVVPRNIYSDNGKLLLIERGSTVTGEYQSNIRQGMSRIFVRWTRIKTPHGVIVDLDSPGTDPLGGAGMPGSVDTHFWGRFGGAMMLSLVDDVARYATQNQGSNSGTINFSSTGEATQNMAVEALKNTINIPPTLSKNQGELIGIYVARDLDFSGVYDVELKH